MAAFAGVAKQRQVGHGAGCALLLCFHLLLAACAAPGCDDRTAADKAAIEAVLAALIAADNAGDLQAAVACYTRDAMLLPPNAAAVAGRAALESRYAAIFTLNELELANETVEVQIARPWAYCRGFIRGRAVSRETGEVTLVFDKYLSILRRTPDAGWKIHQLMWSPAE